LDKAPDAFRTISEVADELQVPQHVLRFWETRFSQIKPMKRGGGRRYYRPDDVDLLRGIRHLLYGEGYTIRGVQRILKEHGIRFVQMVWQEGAAQPMRRPSDDEEQEGAATAPIVDEEAERRGAVFGLLPSLREDDTDEGEEIATPRREPPLAAMPRVQPSATAPRATSVAPAEPVTASTPSAGAALPRDDLRKLQATLHELGECRKLLDAVLTEGE
jgi:DNA-binding transcriptional MerR regulator